MAQDRTSGFDMLIQLSEAELNGQLAAAASLGMLLPSSISRPFNGFGVAGTMDLNLLTPVADLDRNRPNIGLTVPFADSQVAITSPLPQVIAPLGGNIVVVAPTRVVDHGSAQQAVLEFQDVAPQVTVTLDADSVALITPIITPLGITVAMVENQMAVSITASLQNDVQRMPLTPDIPVADDSDPLTPFNFEVTTVNDSTTADRDALTFGVRTSSASGGNINMVNASFIPAGGNSVLMMSNFWLLSQVLRPQVATKLNANLSDFDTPLRLNHSIPISGAGHNAMLTSLEAHVEGNRIRVDGTATASDTGWSARATFHFFIDLSISGGAMRITASEPVIDVDIDLAWWVWVLTFGVGAFLGGIVGGIIAIIVVAIVKSIAEGILERMATDAFNNGAAAIPPIPLGPIGSSIMLNSVVLDDLEFRGPLMRSVGIPIKSQGSYSGVADFSINLDTGVVRANGQALFGTDLVCSPVDGIRTHVGSGLTITGLPYGALTPTRLEAFGFHEHLVPASLIPRALAILWFSSISDVVFGVLTNEGRLARVHAWRDLFSNELHVAWTTYDRPVPTLNIATRWRILERGENSDYHRGAIECTRTPVRRECAIEAWPRLMAFPVDVQWCLCGQMLKDPEGTVTTQGRLLSYRWSGRHLVLSTEMGDPIDCELCVSAIDARQRELFTCIRLEQSGVVVKCRECKPLPYVVPPLEYIPVDLKEVVVRHGWDKVEQLNDHFKKALAAIPAKKS